LISAIALRSRQNVSSTSKNAADLPIDQQSQISFLVRKFNSSAIIAAFSMLIGKVGGAAPMAFFHLPMKKEALMQQF
jgi:hypothetical protein